MGQLFYQNCALINWNEEIVGMHYRQFPVQRPFVGQSHPTIPRVRPFLSIYRA